MSSEKSPTISVITATWNAADHLPPLIESLRAQVDRDFEWLVADGASTDGTLAVLEAAGDLNVKILSQPDFGIYDALNRALRACTADYYLVVGADDRLYPNAIRDFRAALAEGVDMVTAGVQFRTRISRPRGWPSWFHGQFSYVSGHAVGTLIRRSLHERFGLYSRHFPIAADQLFLLRAAKGGACIKVIPEVVGYYDNGGLSSTDYVGRITEFFRVQLLTHEARIPIILHFLFRFLRNLRRL